MCVFYLDHTTSYVIGSVIDACIVTLVMLPCIAVDVPSTWCIQSRAALNTKPAIAFTLESDPRGYVMRIMWRSCSNSGSGGWRWYWGWGQVAAKCAVRHVGKTEVAALRCLVAERRRGQIVSSEASSGRSRRWGSSELEIGGR